MASFPLQAALVFLFLICPEASAFSSSRSISPLAFKCSTPRETAMNFHAARALFAVITKGAASHAGFAASSAPIRGGDRLQGLAQCRPDLPPAACTACLGAAVDAVSSLCMGSDAAAAWFDGCYLHYYYASQAAEFLKETRPFEARSNGSYMPDRALSPAAADTLVRRLVAEAGLPSRRGFSYGEAAYGDGGDRVYAAVECLQPFSHERCVTCLAAAATMARACCSRMEGGFAVAGDCTVQFENHPFLSYVQPAAVVSRPTAAAIDTASTTTYDENGEGDGFMGLKGKVLIAWFVAFACFVWLGTGLWLLRRRILSVKVTAVPGETDEGEKESR